MSQSACCGQTAPVIMTPCLSCNPIYGVVADANEWSAPDCESGHELLHYNPSTETLRMWAKSPDGKKAAWLTVSKPSKATGGGGTTVDPVDLTTIPVQTNCLPYEAC